MIFLKTIGLGIFGCCLIAAFLYVVFWLITEHDEIFSTIATLIGLLGLVLFVGAMIAMTLEGTFFPGIMSP